MVSGLSLFALSGNGGLGMGATRLALLALLCGGWSSGAALLWKSSGLGGGPSGGTALARDPGRALAAVVTRSNAGTGWGKESGEPDFAGLKTGCGLAVGVTGVTHRCTPERSRLPRIDFTGSLAL